MVGRPSSVPGSRPLTFPPFQGSVSDPLEIKHIEVSPDPPQRGQDLTVKVIGNVKEVIDVRTVLSSIHTMPLIRSRYCRMALTQT